MEKSDESQIIDEMVSEAGRTKAGNIVSKGELPLVVAHTGGVGKVTLYDTRTGVPSRMPEYMVNVKLDQTRDDGARVFSKIPPDIVDKAERLKCYLHADDENREHYASLGFQVCKKDNLLNDNEREAHMQHRHSREWATIRREEQRKEHDEDRAATREMRDALLAVATK